ncbi:hypothetical protein [Butyrivibrio sp. WCD2001]|uniref:hypothetical protein n=1 Tax=Butyrivibrio sp. WCD2001 TaxID=1280681 RepID=UPI0004786F1A|nr:hypothetical protein [Butyrivibrio sp. WCD2001]
MTKRKKNDFQMKSFEGVGTKFVGIHGALMADTFTRISESMLQSNAYKSLKPRQRDLYIHCKAQWIGKHKPRHDFKDVPELDSDDLFYFNFDVAVEYGLYTPKSSHLFYNDMKALIESGFIDKVVSGKAHKKKNIYRYSDRWRGS